MSMKCVWGLNHKTHCDLTGCIIMIMKISNTHNQIGVGEGRQKG